MTPKVSILMPVYNGEKYLTLAVESILNQTFADFEFIIIDDGSTDATPTILDQYADPRIVRLRNQPNIGITRTLNNGLEIARGEYIARMDSDDISYPDRLAKQVNYMDAHPEIGLLGTRYIIVDEAGKSIYGEPSPPEMGTRAYIAWSLLWMTSIQHPSAMMRRAVLQAHNLRYDAEYETAEDYELWTRIAQHSVVERLWDTCLDYRVFSQSISNTRRAKQIETHHRILHRKLCQFLGEDLSPDLTRYLMEMFVPGIPQSDVQTDPVEATQTLRRIREKFATIHPLSSQERQYIDFQVRRYMRRALYYAHNRADRTALWRLRGIIFQESPLEFVRLMVAFIGSRLRRRSS